MPIRRRRTLGARRPRRLVRRCQGAGLWDALKSAHDWIKSKKIISTVGNALGSVGIPVAGMEKQQVPLVWKKETCWKTTKSRETSWFRYAKTESCEETRRFFPFYFV